MAEKALMDGWFLEEKREHQATSRPEKNGSQQRLEEGTTRDGTVEVNLTGRSKPRARTYRRGARLTSLSMDGDSSPGGRAQRRSWRPWQDAVANPIGSGTWSHRPHVTSAIIWYLPIEGLIKPGPGGTRQLPIRTHVSETGLECAHGHEHGGYNLVPSPRGRGLG